MSLFWEIAGGDFEGEFDMSLYEKHEQFETRIEEENVLNNNRKNVSSIARTVLLALTILAAIAAFAQEDAGLKFKGGIGVVPVTGVAANGTVNLNVVRGVSPGGPWRIDALNTEIESSGHIKVNGRGLLLASGNGIGTNAGQTVHATLFCGLSATATAFNSPGVALEANGDFTIDDFLSPVPTLPCDNPVLLIRNAVGVWFAAGIPSLEKDKPLD